MAACTPLLAGLPSDHENDDHDNGNDHDDNGDGENDHDNGIMIMMIYPPGA